ncbi:MAG: hypothetical protein KAJ72_02840 [Candidatus Heimdallarchaeota archaeon]|nr:hypothetical protein [Candidatus Heimdallarchaeota archaeon]
MNKKGLIFLFLFVVSTVSAITLTNAEQGDNKVEITIDYIPSAWVPSDEVYVEFDTRFIGDNDVFTEQDVLHFAFFYDVAVIAWASYLFTLGNGWQTDEWFYEPQNNVSAGYTGSDLYNTTRYAGMFNLMLDDYDLGMSNFWLDEDNGNYQEIRLNLDVGWHYLTVVAAEMVSDANHTEFHWTYAKDQVVFYVAEDRTDVPPLIEDALYNTVELVATAVDSEDLGQYYSWTEWLDNPRPVAEAASPVYQTVDVALEGAPVVTEVFVNYNASNNPIELYDGAMGSNYVGMDTMGLLTYMWYVNNADWNNMSTTQAPLKKGQNFIFFNLFANKADDYAQLYGEAAPAVGHDLAVMRVFIGEEAVPTGLGFGILISVSMLGLVSYAFLRKRK